MKARGLCMTPYERKGGGIKKGGKGKRAWKSLFRVCLEMDRRQIYSRREHVVMIDRMVELGNTLKSLIATRTREVKRQTLRRKAAHVTVQWSSPTTSDAGSAKGSRTSRIGGGRQDTEMKMEKLPLPKRRVTSPVEDTERKRAKLIRVREEIPRVLQHAGPSGATDCAGASHRGPVQHPREEWMEVGRDGRPVSRRKKKKKKGSIKIHGRNNGRGGSGSATRAEDNATTPEQASQNGGIGS